MWKCDAHLDEMLFSPKGKSCHYFALKCGSRNNKNLWESHFNIFSAKFVKIVRILSFDMEKWLTN
jgi:hypothetical protein